MERKEASRRLSRAALHLLPFGMATTELFDLAVAVAKSQKDLDAEISEAVEGLKRSAILVSTLEAEVNRRAERLGQLQIEHARLSSLSQITSEQVRALATQIELSIGKSRRWETLKSLAVNLFAGLILFVIGIVASDWVKHIFHLGGR
jgi:predicted nuclease with TOPRIM domain